METHCNSAPLSGFPFAHEDLTWMGSTVTVGSEGTRPQSQSSSRTSGWTHGPCPCRLAGRSGLVVRRPTHDHRWSAHMLSLLLRAQAGWRRALASAMSEGGRGHVARAVRAGAGGRRRRRSPALVLSAKRGAGGTVIRIYDSPRDWTDRVSGRSLSRPARWGSLGLTDGRTGASPDIHSLFPPLPRDGWQAARELRSSARPPVRHHCASLLAAVRTRLAARTRPYGFLLARV